EAHADGTAELSPKLRAIHRPTRHLGLSDTVVTTEGDSVASAMITLRKREPDRIPATAEFMSLGPPGPWSSHRDPRPPFEESEFPRLRVTLGSSERIRFLIIDDIVTARADSRTVKASYVFVELSDARDVWSALQRAPRVLGAGPAGPPIQWLSPSAFTWT